MLGCATPSQAICCVVVADTTAVSDSSFRAVRNRHLAHLSAARNERDLSGTT
jgi:hypothetical protein